MAIAATTVTTAAPSRAACDDWTPGAKQLPGGLPRRDANSAQCAAKANENAEAPLKEAWEAAFGPLPSPSDFALAHVDDPVANIALPGVGLPGIGINALTVAPSVGAGAATGAALPSVGLPPIGLPAPPSLQKGACQPSLPCPHSRARPPYRTCAAPVSPHRFRLWASRPAPRRFRRPTAGRHRVP
jgi:hypothetical protein